MSRIQRSYGGGIMPDNYIFIYQESHQRLGIFEDLEKSADVGTYVVGHKKTTNPLLNMVKRVHLSHTLNQYLPLPLRHVWNQPIKLRLNPKKHYIVVIVDLALRFLRDDFVRALCKKDNVECNLMLINSMDAENWNMQEIKGKIKSFDWAGIYSFDPVDCERYGFRPLGNCYYSKKEEDAIRQEWPDSETRASDIYYIGGLRGNRENRITVLYDALKEHGVNAEFDIPVFGRQKLKSRPEATGLNYITTGLVPYTKVLAEVLRTNVILEVLRDRQFGPSLRYYEAVCYNKKLLTTNPEIVHFPFYDPRYMRVFDRVEDIDFEWVKTKEEIDYQYVDAFSPLHLLDVIKPKKGRDL